MSSNAADALFRVVDAAYQKRSIAISSNIHPSGFGELMPKTMATGEAILYEALRRCELDGLLRGECDTNDRRHELTAAGRRRLRTDRRFRCALARVLVRGSQN